jgi:hypothetical protein
MEQAVQWMVSGSGVKAALGDVPAGIEVCPRYGSGGAVYILINFSAQSQTVRLPRVMTDVLQGGKKESVSLERYGVAVVAAGK